MKRNSRHKRKSDPVRSQKEISANIKMLRNKLKQAKSKGE